MTGVVAPGTVRFGAVVAGIVGVETELSWVRRRVGATLVIAMALTLLSPSSDVGARVDEGCVLAHPVATACSYRATRSASFGGVGPFEITVTFVDGQGAVRTRYALTHASGPYASTFDQFVGIGDTVTARVLGPGGTLVVGYPGRPPHSPVPPMPAAPRLQGDVTHVHDPEIVAVPEGASVRYAIFSTGHGIPVRVSNDLVTWSSAGQVFADNLPPWAAAAIPGTEFPWAPDVAYFGGRWHLYYSVSTFGSKISAIGHATTDALDPAAPGAGWQDEGIVIRSSDLTDYNAIDPNVHVDVDGTPWLTFGSAFGGLKATPLDAATGRPVEPTVLVPVATHPQSFTIVEAPYVVARDGWYYLFASYDWCCLGLQSTYNVRVGRSRSITGPYLDDVGVPLLAGGGRLVLSASGDMRGPGHNAVLERVDGWSLVFHWYDAANAGTPTLGILPISWTEDGWPTV